MQDRHTPPFPPDVEDLDSADEMIVEDDIEEVIELNDPIFESASSSDSEESWKETVTQKDDAVCVFRGHTPGKNAVLRASLYSLFVINVLLSLHIFQK